MIDNIIDKNIIFLQKYGVKMDTDDDKAVYKYGLQILYYYIIDLAVIFALAHLFGRLYETMIITFIFGFFQVFGGGYHAKTPLTCLICMLCGLFLGNILTDIILGQQIFMVISAFLASAIIFMFAPIRNKNHFVGKRVLKRSVYILRIAILLNFLIIILFLGISQNIKAAILASALYLYMISLISAKISHFCAKIAKK